MDYLVPGRECGDCAVCCTVSPIDEPEMQKQASSRCRHRSTGGCGIYEGRPTVCGLYFCGWRRLAFLDDDWRPDKSGVLIESGKPTTVGSESIVLILVGNPLKTVREQRVLDFIRERINQNLKMFLSLPGPLGMAKAALPLNTPEMRLAATQSRSQVRLALENIVRRLSAHAFVPYVMEHSGNDAST